MALNGCTASLYYDAAKVAGLNSVGINITADMVDVTTMDSSCWKEFIDGLKSATIPFSGFYATTDTAGQVAFVAAIIAGTLLEDVHFYVTGTTTGFTGDAYLSDISISADLTAIAISGNLQITGAISVETPS